MKTEKREANVENWLLKIGRMVAGTWVAAAIDGAWGMLDAVGALLVCQGCVGAVAWDFFSVLGDLLCRAWRFGIS